MKKYILCIAVVVFSIDLMHSQTSNRQFNDISCQCNQSTANVDVLITIAGRDITTSEFMYIYDKNDPDRKHNLNEYLDMFINFKLKVLDAEDKGLDKTEKFINEWNSYNEYAKDSFLVDQVKLESFIRLAYQRNLTLRRAAHIAVKCPENATGEEVANAMMKIGEARSRIVEYHERFSDVAVKYSDDPRVKDTKGELGWINQFRYVYPIVDKVYSTPIGMVSNIFRSSFGFHIVLVEEEIPNLFVHAAHIMKLASNNNAKQEISNIYLQLSHGGDFETIATEQSEDKESAARGGDLGYFNRGIMVKEFEDVAFNMGAGEISKPFETTYGWHIIKVYDTKDYRSYTYEEERLKLKRQILRDQAMLAIVAEPFIVQVRKKCCIDSSIPDNAVLDYIRQHMEELSPEYAHLRQEYHDGILLFENSLENVWKDAKTPEEQSRLEKEWLKEMRGKYNVIIHEDALKRLKKSINQK